MMNTVHFGMQAVISNTIFFQTLFKDRSGPTMTWRDYFFRVVPTGLATALDVNLSNESLVFISVTFATMCKSAAPIFLLVFAFAFRIMIYVRGLVQKIKRLCFSSQILQIFKDLFLKGLWHGC
ncbi:uncharacterized protein A4U43_C04F10500 [Asparagus officinalis]|uniref:Sugar phosphate transporter domain-containing protein n=1 Tax=Asparagus officinalis TaxID=4686 RepID=A0A5P1F0J0_ASPOF|nr:probable sugar phosphate/phosphate translocator At1g06470 [Asparagus officinalis]ONK71614.1 uncharacterized protein A4U43_C04F10500 [Asparagus officinalis]